MGRGVVTGKAIVSVELASEGRVAWLDSDGVHGVVSVSHDDGTIYLMGKDGTVTPLTLGGAATFPGSTAVGASGTPPYVEQGSPHVSGESTRR